MSRVTIDGEEHRASGRVRDMIRELLKNHREIDRCEVGRATLDFAPSGVVLSVTRRFPRLRPQETPVAQPQETT